MKNIHMYRRKIKRKTIKSKSEYASKAGRLGSLNIHTLPVKTEERRSEEGELNQARSKPDTFDQAVITARTFVHHYNSTQYYSSITETVLVVFPFLGVLRHCCFSPSV